jgi:hypothetical protein
MVFRKIHHIHPLNMNRVAVGMHNQELIANQSSALKKPQEKLQKAKSFNLLYMGIYLSCRGYILYLYMIGNGTIHLIPFTASLTNAPCSSTNEGDADTHECKVCWTLTSVHVNPPVIQFLFLLYGAHLYYLIIRKRKTRKKRDRE